MTIHYVLLHFSLEQQIEIQMTGRRRWDEWLRFRLESEELGDQWTLAWILTRKSRARDF